MSASVADKCLCTNCIDSSLSPGRYVEGIMHDGGRFSSKRHRNAIRCFSFHFDVDFKNSVGLVIANALMLEDAFVSMIIL